MSPWPASGSRSCIRAAASSAMSARSAIGLRPICPTLWPHASWLSRHRASKAALALRFRIIDFGCNPAREPPPHLQAQEMPLSSLELGHRVIQCPEEDFHRERQQVIQHTIAFVGLEECMLRDLRIPASLTPLVEKSEHPTWRVRIALSRGLTHGRVRALLR